MSSAPPPACLPQAYAAFDCETTGLDAGRDALLQLAAVVFTPEGIREWATLVDPGRPVDLQVQRLTGITPERLRGAPGPAAALRAFRAFVGELPLVAHNAAFDTGFVQAGLRAHRLESLRSPVYDTLALARLLDPAGDGHRLEDLVQRRHLVLEQAHDALEDARAAGLLFADLLRELAGMEPVLLSTLGFLLGRSSDPLADLVRGLAWGPPLPHLVRLQLPPPAPAAATGAELPPEELAELLRADSPIGRLLQPFEERPGQVRMLQAVASAFARQRHLIVEAGTGTGKSLAYLLPALAHARREGARVVVATHTVNLQEQLVAKDLPLLAASGAVPGRVALLKGRSQYACLRLWEERLQVEPEPAEAAFLARFATWLARTETGDRGELGLYGEDEERFGALSCDAVACSGRRCPHYEGCFLFRARREAEQADVVVVNHALLFSALGTDVLPPYDYLVCDEAHHLEDQASQHLGRVVGERALERYWRLLDRGEGPGSRSGGALVHWRARQAAAGLLGDRTLHQGLESAAGALREARLAAEACFGGLRARMARRQSPGGAAWGSLRLEPRPQPGKDPLWDEISRDGLRLARALQDLADAMDTIGVQLDEEGTEEPDRVAELRWLTGRGREWAEAVQLCLDGADGWVTWGELAETRGGAPGAVVLRAAPIDPGPLLQRELFSSKHSVVLTSATLSVRGRFDYLRGRLGLGDNEQGGRTDELLLGSPFDFSRQALLAVPTDAPRPNAAAAPEHARRIAPWLTRLLLLTRGHALVLFTANRLMREVYAVVRPELERAGIACLAQGLDGSRSRLAAALRRGEETVVLGSASFWEGVDVPGDALLCLVIAQLPFWPPDIPLQQARQESIQARGGSPFRELQLPQAVLRFKQGFGRLIRSASDRGVAVVLDPRVAQSEYGRVFLDSLPAPALALGDGEDVLARVAGWLGMPPPGGA